MSLLTLVECSAVRDSRRTLLLLIFATALLAGCASTSSRNAPRVSDAVAEAGKPRAEQQPVAVVPAADDQDDEDDAQDGGGGVADAVRIALAMAELESDGAAATDEDPPPHGAAGPSIDPRFHVSVGARTAWITGRELDAMSGGALGLGASPARRAWLDLSLYFARADLANSPRVQGGIRRASELGLDGALRLDLTPDHTAVGAQVLVGVRAGLFQWDYRNAIEMIDGESGALILLDGDRVVVVSPYAGMGLELLRTRAVRLSVNAIAGVRAHQSTTREGFQNDFFATSNFAEVGVEVSLFPPRR